MSASKNRPRWDDLPQSTRTDIERLVGARIVRAVSYSGGFSPGFASRLELHDGRRVFVKAIDADAWPDEAPMYRAEITVAGALPPEAPAPRLLGTHDDGQMVALAFAHVDGAESPDPWRRDDVERVLDALDGVSAIPAPASIPSDHPRLGGFDEILRDPVRLAALRTHAGWAADDIERLAKLDAAGRAAALGTSLVHFDAYPHNVLLTPTQVVFVDWPHARAGAPVVDAVTVLCSAAMQGIDAEPIVASRRFDPSEISSVLAAHAGFCLAGGLRAAPPGLEPIIETKRTIGLTALAWLRCRL